MERHLQLKIRLSNTNHVSVIIDIWVEPKDEGFIGVTAVSLKER